MLNAKKARLISKLKSARKKVSYNQILQENENQFYEYLLEMYCWEMRSPDEDFQYLYEIGIE